MVGMFFRILITNLGFSEMNDTCKDGSKAADSEEEKDDRKAVIDRFLRREYSQDGSGGGLFPLAKWSQERGSKDQRKVSLWYQMNAWLSEHLDEEERFHEEVV